MSAIQRFKLAAGFFGALLCVAGLWYLIAFISRVDLLPHLSALDGSRLIGLVALTLCLTAAFVLIALSWSAILKDCGAQLSIGRAQLVFSRSNLGKYVPGNVLHMIGRQVLAMREGVSGWVVAKSLGIETSLLALTSALVAGAFWLSQGGGLSVLFSSVGLCLTLAAAVLLLCRFGWSGFARALLGYAVYHLIGGVVFALLFALFGDHKVFESNAGFLAMAYIASWIIGLLTPGAPAGLGVREAVLLGLLATTVSDQAVLAAVVVVSRVMNVVSDVAYFLVVHVSQLSYFSASRRGRDES